MCRLRDLRRLLRVADLTAAMSVEGLLGTDDVFADDLQALRPHPGQRVSAANLRMIMAGSEIRESHRAGAQGRPACTRVQDAYSLRCAPQVAGGARDTVEHAERVAWRIVKDWLEAQLAMIEADLVGLDEVLLPFLMSGGRSLYEVITEQRKGLTKQ